MGRSVFKTLTGKLSFTSTLPFVLVMIILGTFTVLRMEREIRLLSARNLESITEVSALMVRTEVEVSVRNYLRSLAEKNRDIMELYYIKAQRGEISEAEAQKRVREIFLDPNYGKIGATGYLAGVTSRGILAIHPKSPGTDASGMEFMQKAMAMKNGYLEYQWKNVGETEERAKVGYLSYFEPWDIMVWASSYKEEFTDLLDLKSVAGSLESLRVGERGFVLLVSDQGEVLAGSSMARERLRENYADFLKNLTDSIKSVPDGETVYGRGREILVSRYKPIPGINWFLAANEYAQESRRIINTLRIIFASAILIAAVVVHLFIRLFMARSLAPINNIRSITNEVSKGNLSRRIPVDSEDEIGELSELFNQVIEEFENLLYGIKSAVAVLLESTHNLGASTMEISSTANQQAASVREILSTMEDSDNLSKGVAVMVQEVVKIANSTKENVEKGFTLIQESLDKMNEIRSTNANTIGGIKNLGNQIDTIWDIVNIINGIADQTKIIAFNAELEAAAAGDAGKNFQIVASEIRRLADSTVDSTNEIKAKINEIQHASDKLIIASEEGTQRIKEGWEVSHNIRGVFEDVLTSSEISAASADEIAASIKMQVSSFEQIFLTLKQISESIDNFVESTHATTEASDQLKEISDNFNSVVGKYTVKEEVELDE